MKNIVKIVAIVFIGVIMSLLPAPEGLTQDAWIFFSLFVCVFIGLILEPLPSAYIALMGVIIACVLKIGPSIDSTAEVTSSKVIAWGLSGFSNTTVWLIIIAFNFALGYEKTGLGKRISLALVSKMGKSTIGLGYAIALSDLSILSVKPAHFRGWI